MNKSRTTVLFSFLTLASIAGAHQQTHLPTSGDAFLHVQYGTKAEFLNGLRAHPKELYQLARHFNTSQSKLLDYIDQHVVLSKLGRSGTYRVWGIKSNGREYSVSARFGAGMKVWSTTGGTPIMRWLCANPMVASLPAYEEPAVAPTAPPVEPPPAVEPPPPVEPPPAVEPPPPVVVEPPPPPPVEEKKEEVKVEEKKEVTKVETVETVEPAPVFVKTDPRWSIWIGVFEYDRLLKLDRVYNLSYGASVDLLDLQPSQTKIGLYAEGGGHLNQDKPFAYWGVGVQLRQYLGAPTNTWRPYAGIGGGYYDFEINDFDKLHVGFFDHHSQFGGRVFLGTDIGPNFFIEAQALLLGGEFKGRTLNRYALNIGFRF